MLDIIETDLLKKHLPNVSYLRLDGGVPPSQRHGVVNKFNSDPSIDVLLLTTQVGGLGLNLTGADTVTTKNIKSILHIFVINLKNLLNFIFLGNFR